MATLLQTTNKVLKRLREEVATDLTTEDYHNLVASFVADIAAEVNDSGPGWSALDATASVSVVATTRTYDLGSGGTADTTARSTLMFDQCGRAQAWLFDDGSDTSGRQMYYLDPTSYEQLFQRDRDETTEEPIHFTLVQNSNGTGYTLKLYPIPSANRTVRIVFNTPEAVLDPDSDAATSIVVNNRVVELGALWLALNERGEEMGEPGNIAEMRYRQALADAIEDEIRVRERAGYYDWYRD